MLSAGRTYLSSLEINFEFSRISLRAFFMERTFDKILASKYTRRGLLGLAAAVAAGAVAGANTGPERAYAQTPAVPTPILAPRPVTEAQKPWTAIARITSYCLDGLTFLGTKVRKSVVATDPAVIPMRSLIDIEGLGNDFSSEDTGGAVRGRHIDVWDADCDWSINFGVQERRYRVTRWGTGS